MTTGPIGVFDSGIGGLSVVRHLRQVLPHEDIVYFGDTARVPYGSKSRATVTQFALECARFLLQHDPKLIVAACNTASALALPELISELPVDVVGVVEPGAAAAVRTPGQGPIAVIGTEATIGSGSYVRAIQSRDAGAEVLTRACPLLVPIVEEDRPSGDPVAALTVRMYLEPLRERHPRALVLGCTHYPLLQAEIAACMGPEVEVVDSGRETSLVVERLLRERGGLSPQGQSGSIRCYVSDNPARFERVGSRFLAEPISHVEFVEPERYIGVGSIVS